MTLCELAIWERELWERELWEHKLWEREAPSELPLGFTLQGAVQHQKTDRTKGRSDKRQLGRSLALPKLAFPSSRSQDQA